MYSRFSTISCNRPMNFLERFGAFMLQLSNIRFQEISDSRVRKSLLIFDLTPGKVPKRQRKVENSGFPSYDRRYNMHFKSTVLRQYKHILHEFTKFPV